MTVSDCHFEYFVISMDEGLRNLFKEELGCFNQKIFRLRLAELCMTVSDCHSDKFVISKKARLRNLYKEEFKVLLKRCFPSLRFALHDRFFYVCHFDGRRTEKSVSTGIQGANKKIFRLHCAALCMTGCFFYYFKPTLPVCKGDYDAWSNRIQKYFVVLNLSFKVQASYLQKSYVHFL